METLTFILFVAVVILLFLFVSSKSKENSLKQDFELLKSEHKYDLSQIEKRMQTEITNRDYRLVQIEKRMQAEITNRAGEQFQKWRDNECEEIRKQQIEIAKREAMTLLEEWKFDSEFIIRSNAINKSKSVILGQVTEHLIPYLPKFNYNPKDVRFLGNPIDLIVFDGLTNGFVKEIIFIEVKTGSTSRLSSKQQDIRDAVRGRPISWLSMRVNFDEKINKTPITIEETWKASGREIKQTVKKR